MCRHRPLRHGDRSIVFGGLCGMAGESKQPHCRHRQARLGTFRTREAAQMKPHLKKIEGQWFCIGMDVVGGGRTPWEAQASWYAQCIYRSCLCD